MRARGLPTAGVAVAGRVAGRVDEGRGPRVGRVAGRDAVGRDAVGRAAFFAAVFFAAAFFAGGGAEVLFAAAFLAVVFAAGLRGAPARG